MTQESDSLVELSSQLQAEKQKIVEQADKLTDQNLRKFMKLVSGTFFFGLEKVISELAERDADHETRLADLEEATPSDIVEKSYYEHVALLTAFCKSLKIEDPGFKEILDFLEKKTIEILGLDKEAESSEKSNVKEGQ